MIDIFTKYNISCNKHSDIFIDLILKLLTHNAFTLKDAAKWLLYFQKNLINIQENGFQNMLFDIISFLVYMSSNIDTYATLIHMQLVIIYAFLSSFID